MRNPWHKTGRAEEDHQVHLDSEGCQKGELPDNVNASGGHGQVMWKTEFPDTLGGMKKKLLMTSALVLLTVPAVASCASSSATKDTTAIMSLTPVSQVIDVRTPEEFAAGHVQGATNIDVESGAFEAALAGLDKEAPFTIYCRSGRRSAIAADLMAKAGFTQVTDLGTLESAATSLSLPIVTN